MQTEVKCKTNDGKIFHYFVKEIPGSDAHAYEIVDRDGKPCPQSISMTINKNVKVVVFDCLWIEGEQVQTLSYITREKEMILGRLI